MSCFNCNTGDNWWIIILLVILCCCDNDSGILRCLRDLVCGDNLIWIIALLLVRVYFFFCASPSLLKKGKLIGHNIPPAAVIIK